MAFASIPLAFIWQLSGGTMNSWRQPFRLLNWPEQSLQPAVRLIPNHTSIPSHSHLSFIWSASPHTITRILEQIFSQSFPHRIESDRIRFGNPPDLGKIDLGHLQIQSVRASRQLGCRALAGCDVHFIGTEIRELIIDLQPCCSCNPPKSAPGVLAPKVTNCGA